MSHIRELRKMQQSIKELNQNFESLSESIRSLESSELSNELKESPVKRLNDATPAEWDEVSKRFYDRT